MSVTARELFCFGAGLLVALLAGLVLAALVPTALWSARLRAAKWSLVAAAGLIAVPLGLYFWRTSPDRSDAIPPVASGGAAPIGATPAGGSSTAGTMEDAVTRLEQRLAKKGGCEADWELLAQAYNFLGRSADAVTARIRHQVASVTPDAADSVGTTPTGRSDPAAALSPQALEYLRRADDALAVRNDPAAMLTGGAAMPAQAGSGSAAPDSSAGGLKQIQVAGEVSLDAHLKGRFTAGSTLFIIAKSIDALGPPVAVLRTQSGQWPLKFVLDDSLAMMPERTLSNVGRVTVEARISRTGAAMAQSGDLQSAVATVDPRRPMAVRLVISRVIP